MMNPLSKVLLSWINLGTMPIFGGSSLLGGALSLGGALLGGSKASKGAREGAALAQFNPYNISSGIGSSTFDRDNRTGSASLAPRYANQRNRYLNQSQGFGNQLNQFFAPSRDQFVSGYDTSGNRSRDDFYNDLLGSDRFKTSGTDATPYVKDGTAYVSQGMFDKFGGQNTNLYREIMRYGGIPNDIISGDMDVAVDPNLRGSNGGTDFDALNAEADRLFNSQQGTAQYDEQAYQDALNSWVSPEQRIYDRLFKLSEENEQLEKSGLESRLFSQGMLGSTGGAHRLNAQADAAYDRDLNRQQRAVTLAEEIQNQIQARDIRANQAALGLDQANLDNLRLGISAGGGNQTAGQITANNAANQGGAIANAFSSFGDNFSSGGLFGGGGGINTFDAPNTDINSITNSFFG